ncbi:hypothetical protein RRF57_012845 [Xylaria bambusicola]|uniref:GST N-terminal domain-containing protein n=1 Tax=Xylaria bambusicola TaxID=326684 RepID=A0AAN7ZF18_9PEZI
MYLPFPASFIHAASQVLNITPGWGVRAQLILEYFNIPYKVQYFNYTIPALTPPPELKTLPVLDVTPAPGATAAEETLRIHDSLAIAEFLADQHPEKHLWPADPQLRALARVAAAQMHSGFAALRDACPSNFVSHFSGPGIPFPEAAAADVQSFSRCGTACAWLLRKGSSSSARLIAVFSVRLRSYDVPLAGSTDEARMWMATMWNDPVLKAQGKEYFRQARDPKSHFGMYDDIFKASPNVTSGTFSEDWVFDGTNV